MPKWNLKNLSGDNDTLIGYMYNMNLSLSLLCFAITCWFGNCSRESKGTCKLTKIINICTNLGVSKAKTLSALYEASVLRRCDIIRKDENHPLCSNYKMLPSGKRLKAIKCRTSRYSNSLIPSSVKLLNSGRKF